MNLIEGATVAAASFAGVGLILNAWQLSRATRQRRVEQVTNVFQQIFDDHDLAEIYYLLEYGKFDYTDTFHGSDKEKKLDKLLALFNSLARLRTMGLLKISDLDLVTYEYLVIYQDKGVKQYLAFLDQWYKKRKIDQYPFENFRITGEELEKRYYKRRHS